jgi:hypothetical protein
VAGFNETRLETSGFAPYLRLGASADRAGYQLPTE